MFRAALVNSLPPESAVDEATLEQQKVPTRTGRHENRPSQIASEALDPIRWHQGADE